MAQLAADVGRTSDAMQQDVAYNQKVLSRDQGSTAEAMRRDRESAARSSGSEQCHPTSPGVGKSPTLLDGTPRKDDGFDPYMMNGTGPTDFSDGLQSIGKKSAWRNCSIM
jgi:hypothetical protein